MNEYSQKIKQDVDVFSSAVQRLGAGIKGASSLWKDSKYSELSSEIGQIANLSKSVIVSGDRCSSSIEKFCKIAEEEY